MEKKWGICQKNKKQNIANVWLVTVPVAAIHPPTGGRAPGIAPIKVFHSDLCFMGVYTKRYTEIVINDNSPEYILTIIPSSNTPAVEAIIPNIRAPFGVILPDGNGLESVRCIFASCSLSMYSFNIATPAEDKTEPIIRCVNTAMLLKTPSPKNLIPRKYPKNVEIRTSSEISGFVSSQ